MRYVLALVIVLIATTGYAACDPSAQATTTPRASLKRPATKQCDWNVPLQQTIDLLDSNGAFLNVPSSWSAPQTFAGGIKGQTMRLGGLFFDLGAISLTTNDEWTFRLEAVKATVNRVECEAYTGTSFTIKICNGEDTGDDTCTQDLLTAPLVCDTGGAATSGISSFSSVNPRDKVTIVITAVSGAVTKGEIYIQGVTS